MVILISINGIQEADNDLITEKTNIRLIHFRRNKVHFNGNLQRTGHDIIYFIGYQYLTKEGKNKKSQNCKQKIMLHNKKFYSECRFKYFDKGGVCVKCKKKAIW